MTRIAQIGHTGGPGLPLPPKLTAAQARALQMIRDHGNSAHGFRTNSQYGGWNNTHSWMVRHGLSFYFVEENREVLTERGERVRAAGRMVE